MKMLKKILLGVLSMACILATAGGLSACATKPNLVYYALPDGTYAVEQGEGFYFGDIVVPATYKGAAVTMVVEGGFSSSKAKSITLPDSITRIEDRAFSHCTRLKKMVIPDSVTSIGDFAFVGCDSLSVYITDIVAWCNISGLSNLTGRAVLSNVWEVKTNLYLNNELVTDLVIPDSVTSIGSSAFFGCDSLTSVVIADSVTRIGEYAFSRCGSLTSVVIPDSVTSIGNGAFICCRSLTSVVIPDSVTSIGNRAFLGCSSLTNITVDENNENYKDIDGNLYTKDGTTFIQYATGKTASSFTIPDSVTSIGDDAFYECSSLTSVVIGDSVTSIGDGAFEECSSLTSVVIGDSVTSIGDGAFEECSSLTSVVIPDSVTSIGGAAFYKCSSLTSVVIGDSVTSIGWRAFYKCSKLKWVFYNGTASEWDEISIRSENSKLTSATRYYYSESQPTTSGRYWHYDENGKVVMW